MRIHPGPVVLWLVATTASIAVAAAAIMQVGREIVLETPIDERLAAVAAPEDTEVASPPDGAATDAPATDAPGDDQAATQPSDDALTDDAPTDGHPVEGDTAPQPITRTYESVGGSAAIVVTGTNVEVGWATPRPGFRVDVERASDGHELRVEFRSDDHRSRIKVSVEHGEIRDEIDEDDRR